MPKIVEGILYGISMIAIAMYLFFTFKVFPDM
jgi:hypothetical protein